MCVCLYQLETEIFNRLAHTHMAAMARAGPKLGARNFFHLDAESQNVELSFPAFPGHKQGAVSEVENSWD